MSVVQSKKELSLQGQEGHENHKKRKCIEVTPLGGFENQLENIIDKIRKII